MLSYECACASIALGRIQLKMPFARPSTPCTALARGCILTQFQCCCCCCCFYIFLGEKISATNTRIPNYIRCTIELMTARMQSNANAMRTIACADDIGNDRVISLQRAIPLCHARCMAMIVFFFFVACLFLKCIEFNIVWSSVLGPHNGILRHGRMKSHATCSIFSLFVVGFLPL